MSAGFLAECYYSVTESLDHEILDSWRVPVFEFCITIVHFWRKSRSFSGVRDGPRFRNTDSYNLSCAISRFCRISKVPDLRTHLPHFAAKSLWTPTRCGKASKKHPIQLFLNFVFVMHFHVSFWVPILVLWIEVYYYYWVIILIDLPGLFKFELRKLIIIIKM